MSTRVFLVVSSEWGSTFGRAEEILKSITNQNRDKLSLSDSRTACGVHGETLAKIVDFKDELWISKEASLLFLIATSEDGQAPSTSRHLMSELTDQANDHRYDRGFFENVKYSIVGFGSRTYGGEKFCQPAIGLDRALRLLGAKRQARVSTIDVDSTWRGLPSLLTGRLEWLVKEMNGISSRIARDMSADTGSDTSFESEDDINPIEDVGAIRQSSSMITENQRKILTRQGYKIIGTHSAVKLCRWTKHQLRGQGGCYKHTFYGIQSHQCMEATPSLACANKCVFCWRHHQNPVAKGWLWDVDDPREIVTEGLEFQHQMIKQLRGMPGVTDTGRLEEGLNVRHCALSLVGEPIMYPGINELINELHARAISTFLVTNAQFPEQLESLTVCTQLYVSIDATNAEALKRIDRPLFSDYWERFERCLRLIKTRHERTVYRLTLVKDHNLDDVRGYARLVSLGHPNLIELKGVTFSGNNAGGIRMTNVPTYEEVAEFATLLARELQIWHAKDSDLPLYCIALGHEHSCSVLIANSVFRNSDGTWRLWIDYPKFFQWAKAIQSVEEGSSLSGLDYSTDAPAWAHFGAEAKGFDPLDSRKYSKNRLKMMSDENRDKCGADCSCA